MNFLTLVLVNLGRNKRRTALLLCAIAVLFFAAVIVKYEWLMR